MSTNENTTAREIADFEAQTGWSWSDAVDEAATIQRENRIFGNRSSGFGGRKSTRANRKSYAQRFFEATGWTIEAAREMAWDLQRERRIFGRVA